MKFYVISIILNLLLLFVPITLPQMKKNEKKDVHYMKINVNIEKLGNNKENLQKTDEKNESKKNEISKKIEKKIENKEKIIKNNVPKKEVNFTDSNSGKITNENNKNIEGNSNKIGNDVENSFYTGHSSTSNKGSTVGEKNESGKTKGVNEKEGGNVCKEGIDYVVNYTPTLPYPIMAQRIGITGDIVVNVKFNFKNDGKIVILSVSGGHKIFQDEAKRATSKIKITIKNKESLKCTITKPFRFKKNNN